MNAMFTRVVTKEALKNIGTLHDATKTGKTLYVETVGRHIYYRYGVLTWR